jgi:hypothetical protein
MPVNEQTVIVNGAIAVTLVIALRCSHIKFKIELFIKVIEKVLGRFPLDSLGGKMDIKRHSKS